MRYMGGIQTEQNKVFKVRNQTTGFFQHRNDHYSLSRCSLHNGYVEKTENKRQGNKAKLEDPIPEQFGLVKAFPDYISDKHYFYVGNVRYMSMLLCQGVGYYDWSLNTMYIGSTPISSYVGSDIDVLVADPNTDISSHDAHRCWFNSTEVTSAGKEVPATDSNSRKRGELISETFTLNGLNLSMSSGHELVSGDIIRLYNLSGQDRAINVSAVETML